MNLDIRLRVRPGPLRASLAHTGVCQIQKLLSPDLLLPLEQVAHSIPFLGSAKGARDGQRLHGGLARSGVFALPLYH